MPDRTAALLQPSSSCDKRTQGHSPGGWDAAALPPPGTAARLRARVVCAWSTTQTAINASRCGRWKLDTRRAWDYAAGDGRRALRHFEDTQRTLPGHCYKFTITHHHLKGTLTEAGHSYLMPPFAGSAETYRRGFALGGIKAWRTRHAVNERRWAQASPEAPGCDFPFAVALSATASRRTGAGAEPPSENWRMEWDQSGSSLNDRELRHRIRSDARLVGAGVSPGLITGALREIGGRERLLP